LDKQFFNAENTGVATKGSLFLRPPAGVLDTINRHWEDVFAVYKQMKDMDWDEMEFDFSKCLGDWQAAPSDVVEMMKETIAWQWEADSVAAQSIAFIISMYDVAPELYTTWLEVTRNENVHALTYSEIVKNSFDNPSEVMAELMANQESLERLGTIGEVMNNAQRIGLKRMLDQSSVSYEEAYEAILMFTVALYCLERLQFIASFAITFAIADTGMFTEIGTAVQKIAQDELEVHAKLDLMVLNNEKDAMPDLFNKLKPKMQKLIDEVELTELAWTRHLFKNGERQLVGVVQSSIEDWVKFNAAQIRSSLGIEQKEDAVLGNPLPYMADWLDLSKMQTSPQEQTNSMYKLGAVDRKGLDELDFDDEEFDL
jgi:ribonucleoside-diphosphate reductase beta chain